MTEEDKLSIINPTTDFVLQPYAGCYANKTYFRSLGLTNVSNN